MPTYARREGGAYARGEEMGLEAHPLLDLVGHGEGHHVGVRGEVALDRDLDAGRSVHGAAAEGTRQRRLLLQGLELDEARHARGAAVMHKAESVHWTEGLAQGEHASGERVEVARAVQLVHDVRFHGRPMLGPGLYPDYP